MAFGRGPLFYKHRDFIAYSEASNSVVIYFAERNWTIDFYLDK
jgi:hypothetical protein